MKVIIDTDLLTDNITSIAASSEDANFPAASLQNDYPTDLWKAANGVLEANITAQVSKGSAIEIFNTNATSAEVQAGSGATYETEETDASQVEMSYAASGSTGITVADNDNLDFGTGNFTLRWKGSLPDWTPSANVYLFDKYVGSPTFAGYELILLTTGSFRFRYGNNTSAAVQLDITGIPALADGSEHEIVVTVSKGATDGTVTLYIDGIAVGTPATMTGGATITVSNIANLYISGINSARYASTNKAATLFNRALTAAEVLSLYQSGVATADQWGSQTAVYTSNFSAGYDSFSGVRLTRTGNIDSISDGTVSYDDVLRFNADDSDSTHYSLRSGVFSTYKKYRVSFDYYIPSTNTNLKSAYFQDGASATGTNGVSANVTGAWTHLSFELTTTTNTALQIALKSASSFVFKGANSITDDLLYIKNVVITEIGATLDLEQSSIAHSQWTDRSTNGLNASYPAAGTTVTVQHNLESGYAFEDSESYVTKVYSLPGTNGRLWADYPETTTPHVVKVKLTAASTVEAGIVRAGNVEEFNDPHYGLEEDSVDYSVEKELNNGANYFRKKNVVRTFSNLEFLETRANCHALKHDIFDAVGPKPLAIRLVHKNITDWEFCLFAKRAAPPKIIHDAGKTLSRINLALKEVT